MNRKKQYFSSNHDLLLVYTDPNFATMKGEGLRPTILIFIFRFWYFDGCRNTIEVKKRISVYFSERAGLKR